MWCKTRPLTNLETEAYIAQRLQAAGATQLIFSPDAVQMVHGYSKGIPRLINLICEHSLINGYAEQIKPIPARIVAEVGQEFALDQRPFLISSTALPDSPESDSLHEPPHIGQSVSIEAELTKGI